MLSGSIIEDAVYQCRVAQLTTSRPPVTENGSHIDSWGGLERFPAPLCEATSKHLNS
jgi:hypothetical protein